MSMRLPRGPLHKMTPVPGWLTANSTSGEARARDNSGTSTLAFPDCLSGIHEWLLGLDETTPFLSG